MIVRVFEDTTGFFFSPEDQEMMTSGTPIATAADATREAIQWAQFLDPTEDHALIGSGVCRRTAASYGVKVLEPSRR